MAQKTYISLDKLRVYDEKIKTLIDNKDAAALKSAKDYADGLAVNYDAVGSANSALEAAKAYADGKDSLIAEAKKAGTDAAAAAAVADGKAVAAQGEVDALEAYVGTFTHDTAKSVVEYINAKTDGIATSGNLEALGARVTTVEGKVATIEGDYLKAADRTALEGQISGVSTAVDTEKSRAEGIEAGLRTDIDKVMGDYLKAADKTELQGNIDTVAGAVERLTNGVSADEIDGVNDLINYVKEHGTEVTGMQEDISDNADAISGVAGRVDTLEGEMDDAQAAILLKAEKTYVDEQVQALQGVDTGLDNRLKAVEAAVGESGSVAGDIATAKQEAIDAAAADATQKANAAEQNAKTYADGLNTAMDARVGIVEAKAHEHSNKTLLDTYTQTEANLADAVAKKHEHSNLTVLEGITSAKVTAWDAAEQNAKTYAKNYADGLNSDMGARVTTLETWHSDFVECSEADINGLFA